MYHTTHPRAFGRTSQTRFCCRGVIVLAACLFYWVIAASYRSRFIADAVMRRRWFKLRQPVVGKIPVREKFRILGQPN
eukprot:scaffold34712_cov66-Cyclotella_meneghiniana.AAC.3